MATLGTKWKPIIIYALAGKRLRFGQIAAKMGIISRKVLTQQLQELEEDGIIVREAFKELPPRVEYRLSEKGRELLPILQMMASWHQKYEIQSGP